jgi:iron complex transport system substrate-binding protein
MKSLRIVSFLPAATEMIYLLELQDSLVGRSHECDYPQQAREKPVLSDCALDLSQMSVAQIDIAVSERLASGKSLYSVDETRLRAAAPDLLVTQNLCQVCGPAGNEVSQVIKTMSPVPKILWQSPRNCQEMLEAVRALGDAAGKGEAAQSWAEKAALRIQNIAAVTKSLNKVKVSFLEWVDPIYCGGHWIPEMLSWAGCEDHNSNDGTDSVRISWQKIIDFQPAMILVSPCGFNTGKALEQAALLESRPGWGELPAVKTGHVFAVDANAYFARPGPRLVEGVELLAHLAHPEHFPWNGPKDAYCRTAPLRSKTTAALNS